jgi:hypothetical protein
MRQQKACQLSGRTTSNDEVPDRIRHKRSASSLDKPASRTKVLMPGLRRSRLGGPWSVVAANPATIRAVTAR